MGVVESMNVVNLDYKDKLGMSLKDLIENSRDQEDFANKLNQLVEEFTSNNRLYNNFLEFTLQFGKSFMRKVKPELEEIFYKKLINNYIAILEQNIYEKEITNLEYLNDLIDNFGISYFKKSKKWFKAEDFCIRMANIYNNYNKFKLALKTYNEVFEIKTQNKNWDGIDIFFKTIRELYIKIETPINGLKFFKLIIKKFLKEKNWLIIGLANEELGNTFNYQGKYNQAIKKFNEAIICFEKCNLKRKIANLNERVANLYIIQYDFEKSIIPLQRIIDFEKSNSNWDNIHNLFNRLQKFLEMNNTFENVIITFEEIINTADLKNDLVIAYIKRQIGKILSNREDDNLAIQYFEEALKIFKKYFFFYELGNLVYRIGKIYSNQENFQKALLYYQLSFRYNEEICSIRGCQLSKDLVKEAYIQVKNKSKFLKNLIELTLDKAKNKKWEDVADNLRLIAFLYEGKEKFEKTNIFYHISLYFYKKTKRWDIIYPIYFRLGNNFEDHEKYYDAKKAYYQSIKYQKKAGDGSRYLETYVKIGNVLRMENKYDEAIKIIKKSINEYVKIGKIKDIAYCQALIGDISKEKRDFKESNKFWKKAYENYDEYIQILLNDDKNKRLGFYFLKIGELSLKLEKLDLWEDQLNKSIDFNAKYGIFLAAAKTCNVIAEYFISLKKYDHALSYCKKCLYFNEKKENIKGLAISYSKMGDSMAGLGRFGEAINHYENSFKKNEVINNVTEIAILEVKIGNCFFNQGNIIGAIEYYKRAIEHNIVSGEILASARLHSKVGEIYFQQKMFDKALSHYRESLIINYKRRVYYGLAIIYVQFGNLYLETNKLKFALHYFKISMKYDRKLGLLDNVAHSYSVIGDIYARLNERRNALKYLEKSLNLNEKLENWEAYSICINKFEEITLKVPLFDLKIINGLLNSIEIDRAKGDWTGVCYRYLTVGFLYSLGKDYKNTILYYEKSLNDARRNGLWRNVCIAHLRLGQLYFKIGPLMDAVNQFEKVLEFDKAENQLHKVSIDYIHIGDAYFKWQKYEKALEYYENALKNDREIDDEKGVCISNAKLAELYLRLGLAEKSLTSLEEVLEYNEKTGEDEVVAKTKTKMGNLYIRLGRYDDAMQHYIDALNIDLDKGNLEGIIISRAKIAKLYSIKGEFDKAIENYKIVLNYNKERGDKLSVYKTQSRIAYFYFNQGNWNKAAQYYDDILDYLEQKREYIDNFYYFLNQSLRCKARISENKGDLISVSKIYADIAENYKQINSYYYYYFYNLLTQFFKAELYSIEGNHQNSLDLLIDLEARLEYFMEYIESEPKRGSLYYLLNFRTKNVKANIYREKAFLSVVNGDYEEAGNLFIRCAANYTNIIPKRYKQDFLLYSAIEEYYLGHSEWCSFKIFCKKHSKDYLSQAQYLTKNVLKHFTDAQEIYIKLNQSLRIEDIQYEISLIKGARAALNNNIVDADSYYKDALLRLKQINEEKSSEFENIFNQTRDLRRFPIDRLFLHTPSRGTSFIEPCNLVGKELKKEVIDFNINIPSLFSPVNKDVDFTVNIQINSNIDYLLEEFYYIKVRQTQEKVKIPLEEDITSAAIPFSLPFEKQACSKIYYIDLEGPKNDLIITKKLPIHFIEDSQEGLEDQFSKVVYEVFGKNTFNEIENLIQKERFQEIKDGLDTIYTRVNKYKIRSFIDIFKKLISAFSESFIFNFNIVMGLYIEVNKKIDSIFVDLTENEKIFFKNMKEEYIHWFLEIIQNYFKNLKSYYNTRKIHPLMIEAYVFVIKSYYRNGNYPLVPQLTVAFFERIMNKIITRVHHLDYNNFDWNCIDLDEYKRLYSKETGFPVESIVIDPKISFMSGKTVLMLLNAEFRKYSEKDENSKSLNTIRQVRNDSPIEHGSVSPGKDQADLCIKLIKELKEYNFGTPIFDFFNFFPKKMDFISKFIGFFEDYFIRREDLPLDESDIHDEIEGEFESKKILEKLDSIEENVREIKTDVKTGFLTIKQDLKQFAGEIKYEITDAKTEIKEFSSRFTNPKILETFTQFFIDAQKDKILPPIKDVRVSTRNDRKHLKKAIDGWFNKYWYGMKRIFRLIRPIVFEFICENEDCKHTYRFIFYERTKLAKVGLILLRIGGLTDNLFRFISKYNSDFTLWISKDGEYRLKSKIETIRRSSNLTPNEIQFLYRLLFGIEDKDSKRLSETFDLRIINQDIKFYCKNCRKTD